MVASTVKNGKTVYEREIGAVYTKSVECKECLPVSVTRSLFQAFR